MTISLWFDGDATLWDRRGYMLASLLEREPAVGDGARDPELFSDVLPTFVTLSELGTLNLIEYAPMPQGHEDLLPPFTARVKGPASPSDLVPSLHETESKLNWIALIDDIESAAKQGLGEGVEPSDIVIISDTLAGFEAAHKRGMTTVWVNRDGVANLSDVEPMVEVHTLLDVPEALEAIDEARAAALGEAGV